MELSKTATNNEILAEQSYGKVWRVVCINCDASMGELTKGKSIKNECTNCGSRCTIKTYYR